MKSTKLVLTLGLSLAFMYSCTDKEREPKPELVPTPINCLEKEFWVNDTLRQSFTHTDNGKLLTDTYYGNKGKVSQITRYVYGTIKTYVITEKSGGFDTTKYTMGSNGYASERLFGNIVTHYEYDPSGYLIKENNGFTEKFHSYTSGNQTKTEEKDLRTGVIISTRDMEYTTSSSSLANAGGSLLLGKRSKHLISKSTISRPGQADMVYSYNYEFDANGNVSIITINNGTELTHCKLVWDCR